MAWGKASCKGLILYSNLVTCLLSEIAELTNIITIYSIKGNERSMGGGIGSLDMMKMMKLVQAMGGMDAFQEAFTEPEGVCSEQISIIY